MLGRWVFLTEHRETSSPRLSSVFQVDVPILGTTWPWVPLPFW